MGPKHMGGDCRACFSVLPTSSLEDQATLWSLRGQRALRSPHSAAPASPLDVPLLVLLPALPYTFREHTSGVLQPGMSLSEAVSWGIVLIEYLKKINEPEKQKYKSCSICQLCIILKGC